MTRSRRLAPRSFDQLCKLSEARLLAYRRKVLSLENCPEDSDYSPRAIASLDPTYVWFKSDARWQAVYDDILAALAVVQASR